MTDIMISNNLSFSFIIHSLCYRHTNKLWSQKRLCHFADQRQFRSRGLHKVYWSIWYCIIIASTFLWRLSVEKSTQILLCCCMVWIIKITNSHLLADFPQKYFASLYSTIHERLWILYVNFRNVFWYWSAKKQQNSRLSKTILPICSLQSTSP